MEKVGKCILCKSKISKLDGYGHVRFRGRSYCEHQMVFAINHPNIDTRGKIIHHICKHPWCVNPKHLVCITRKQHAKEHGLSGWAKIHAEKTHCKNGHKFGKKIGRQRTCSICLKKYKSAWYLKNKKRK